MKDNDIDKYKPIEGQHEAQNFGEENLKKFVDDFLAGKVPQHYLTEKLPEDWNSKPVKVWFELSFYSEMLSPIAELGYNDHGCNEFITKTNKILRIILS